MLFSSQLVSMTSQKKWILHESFTFVPALELIFLNSFIDLVTLIFFLKNEKITFLYKKKTILIFLYLNFTEILDTCVNSIKNCQSNTDRGFTIKKLKNIK